MRTQMSDLYLGMAVQAFITAGLMKTELLKVSPGQQVVAGAIFLVMSLTLWLVVGK